MFDFLKNLTKSDEAKRQEAFSAYLDDKLSTSQRRDFEALMAQDADLRAEMKLAQQIRQQMQEMPRRSVPRSFTLNATAYGSPKKEPLVQAYPLLRAATVMAAFFFVMALGLSMFTMQGTNDMASVAQSAMEPAPAFDAPMAESEIAMEEAVKEPAEEMTGEAATELMPTTKSVEDTIISETEMVDEEPAAEEAEGEAPSETEPESPVGAGAGPATTPTLIPTATVSALPRPTIEPTAVARLIEPTLVSPDDNANGIDGETAVTETVAAPEPIPQTRTISTTQILLIGLGCLLLLLVLLTLIARQRI